MEGKYIPYAELLKTAEWHRKRYTILSRDHFKCTNCHKEETFTEYDEERHEVWYCWIDYDVIVRQADGTYKKCDMDFTLADKPYHMQVHHKRYILNRLPWEYNNEDLITLCNWCHSTFHQSNEVDIFAEDGKTLIANLKPCSRCHGAGSFPEYSHVQSGICFSCGGERYEQPLVNINRYTGLENPADTL
ncbi:hypothetical protein JAO76_12495 [Pontibacter sp. BT310]|uniref:HNH domain-containing protein n=2 Tax=Pontibacter populi TaxID=890055 RepID=A0ABS6XCZ5_9BACT|nr:hypothetical protein [Pontibacter sp. BT310]MBJ6119018.1 hypothetical protein [Pontibacter sp. BT310]MBR0571446.1 hypothetical protein [Microvirga sp. STS03]MBW3365872.1 hypothetical protein [Pontibacter populi]